MLDWIALTLFGLALLVIGVGGVVGHHVLHKVKSGSVEGLKLDTLVQPIATFAVILVSFTLITTYAGHREAQNSADEEAGTVDQVYEVAGMLSDPVLAQRMQGHVICYGRSVERLEWPRLARKESAPEVHVWTSAMEADIKAVKLAGNESVVLSKLLDIDAQRAKARQIRLSRANPAAPILVLILLAAAAAAAVFALALLVSASVPKLVHLPTILTFAMLLAGALIVVADMNRPYGGNISISNVAMGNAVRFDLRDFITAYPGAQPPCDETGIPLR